MKRLRDRVAVVTGAASGIGRATAAALAARGCDLALADVDEAGLEETVRLVEAQGRKASRHRVDVADKAQMEAFARTVIDAHGGVQIVVNNAGVALSDFVKDMDLADMEWLFGINWWGVVYGTHYFLPHLLAADEGHIVNLSSLFGLIGVPTQSAYCAAKFAVRGYTESLRAELRETSVGVTCVHPGGIDTAIAANARFRHGLQGEDKAAAVANFKRLARTSPETAADRIVGAIRKGKPRLIIGGDAQLLQWLQRLAPVGYARLLTAALKRS